MFTFVCIYFKVAGFQGLGWGFHSTTSVIWGSTTHILHGAGLVVLLYVYYRGRGFHCKSIKWGGREVG